MTFTDIANFKFIKALQKQGGEVFLVGGIVRDHFLGIKSKDIDLVVRNHDIDHIMSVLKDFGKLTETTVADKMGILKFVPHDIKLDEEIDIALPRTERLMTKEEMKAENVTNAHNAFMVNSDPLLPITMDLERRDFTINSMAINLADMSLIDPFNGSSDILDKVIKHTNDQAFSDDPLRMFRAVQFTSRFKGFGIHADTMKLIAKKADSAKTISGERVHAELLKIFNKGDILKGLRALQETKLHSVLFPDVWFGYDSIATMADFFFHICGNSANFKKVLKGDTKTAKGIDAITKIKAFTLSHTATSTVESKLDSRLVLFNAMKLSTCILHSGKVSHAIKLAQADFKIGKLPKSTKELSISGKDLMAAGIPQGQQIGQALDLAIELVLGGAPNQKDFLLDKVVELHG